MTEIIHASNAVLADIYLHSSQGIIVLDSVYTIQAINPQAAQLLSVTDAQVEGRNLREVCPQFFVKDNFSLGMAAVLGSVHIKAKLIELDDNVPNPGYVLFLEPEPEEEKWHLLGNIINSINDSILVCDAQGQVILYNDANQRMDGLVREEVLGQHVTSIYKLTESQSLLLQAIKQRKPLLNNYQNYTTFAGRNLNIMCSTYPLFENEDIIGAVSVMKDYSEITELYNKVIELQEELFKKNKKGISRRPINQTKYTFNDIVGSSKAIQQSITWAKRAATSNSHVLIYGETGTGKELFAQSIHNASPRAANPFVAINCAAIPENLLEGILFGTTKGAFTGAIDRPGLFEQANGGTLLLDEINSMSTGLQAKLLRVLQEGTVRRLGDIDEIIVDVRTISNINMDPTKAIREKQLREDLFYRLSAVYLEIPALRHRIEDIPLLSDTFLTKYNRLLGKEIQVIAPEAIDMLLGYAWPGNVREFEHAIESAMNLIENSEIVLEAQHFPAHICTKVQKTNGEANITITLPDEPLSVILEEFERLVISQVLSRNKWNVSRTARQLDIKRQSLQYRIRKYRLKQI